MRVSIRLAALIGVVFPVLIAGCDGGDTETPASSPTDPTAEFDIVAPDVDTDWPDTDTDADTDADTDSDTDADTDADTDTDTDADTDTDTDTDTGTDTDTSVTCELTLSVEVRDAGGAVCGVTNCVASDEIVVVAIAKNDCTVDLPTPGTTDCFASAYDVEETVVPTPDARTPAPCTGTPATVTVGTAAEQPLNFGTMAAGAYQASVTFADTAVTERTSLFTVLP